MLARLLFFPSYVINRIVFAIRRVNLGKNVKLFGIIKLCRSGKLRIGDNTIIQSCRYANPLSNRSVFEIHRGAEVCIGRNVGISGSVFKSEKRIVIEDNVMIGGGCMIMDTDSHPINYDDRIVNRDDATGRMEVVLKEGCFIGARSIILKGVIVGKHSVVAAGSVVSRNIPDEEIWGGNPAVFIRKINY